MNRKAEAERSLFKKTLASETKRARRLRRGPNPLTHAGALRWHTKIRPYDPADAAAHIFAVFVDCPIEYKRQLLARLKMIVRDMDPSWGGFSISEWDKQ